jgi:hypothetical protein
MNNIRHFVPFSVASKSVCDAIYRVQNVVHLQNNYFLHADFVIQGIVIPKKRELLTICPAYMVYYRNQ